MVRFPLLSALGALLLASLACGGVDSTDPPPTAAPAHDPASEVRPEDAEAQDAELTATPAEPLPNATAFQLAGEPRLFGVELAVGEYLEVVAEQGGVDVSLALTAPDGSTILTVDSLNGPAGVETLAAVATVAGHHRLTVRPLPDDPAGEVVLRVVARRPAREPDRRYAEVLAAHLRTPVVEDPEVRHRLLGARRRQLRRLGGLDRPLLRARVERALGDLLFQDGRVRDALDHFERALPAIRAGSTDWELTALLNDAGRAARLSGRPDDARADFEESLHRADAIDHDPAAATALNNLGVLSEGLGDLEAALRFYDLAVARWRRLDELQHLGTTLHNVGLTYLSLGLFDEADHHLQQALELRRRTEDRHGEAVTLAAVGWAASLEGDYRCALDLYGQALELRRLLGDRRGEAATLDQRGTALRALGRDAEALADFEAALGLLRESGNRVSEAHVLANLGEVLLDLGRSGAALDHQRAALALFRSVGDRQGEARALVDLAAIEHRRGRLETARGHFERALELVESIRGRLRSSAFRTSYTAARWEAYSGYVDLLLELDAAEPGAGHGVHAFETVERARARGLREGLGGERGWWRRADPELRAEESRLRQRINLLEDRRFTLLEDGAPEGSGAAGEVATLEAEIEELVREYEKLEGRLRRSAGAQGSPPHALTLEEIQAALEPGVTLLVYHLGDREVVWLVEHDRFLTRPLAGAAAGGDSAAADPVAGTPVAGTPVAGTPVATATLAARARTTLARSGGVGRLSQAEADAAALAERVLGPVFGELQRQVVVVADGALATVPFAALPLVGRTGGTPLVEEHEVAHLPSISVLPLLRRAEAPPEKQLAMIADPVFSADDTRIVPVRTAGDAEPPAPPPEPPPSTVRSAGREPAAELFRRLPYAGVEAEAILALAERSAPSTGARLKKVGPEADLELVRSGRLAGYRIVHFATHGWVDDRHPTLSGIVLSRFDAAGRPRPGFLRVHEIERLDLPAELVVLSACRTALGDTVRGEGVVGMTHAFFRAGARRLVVSYWRVDDRATAALMERFYRHLLLDGEPPAAALAAAQRWMRNETEWRAPYFWSAFALQGDWR